MSRADWDASLTWMQKKHHLWEFTDEDAREALSLLDDPEPEPKEPPSIQVHRAGPRENEGG